MTVRSVGALALIEDVGRAEFARWGVARSGAADRGALRQANRLVGNSTDAAAIECLLGGLSLRCDQSSVIAVTGAPCDVHIDGRAVDRNRAHAVNAGSTVQLGTVSSGLRMYLAVRGGIDVAIVLGSRSRDVLAAIGPAPLAVGDVLPIGNDVVGEAWFEYVPDAPPRRTIRVAPGPRLDWFESDALHHLATGPWTVRSESDRTGLRLTGPAVTRRKGDLASEATLPGAIQVPPDGQPIVLGPDAGVSGGYPVLAVVIDQDLDLLAQLRPGDPVPFSLD